MKLKRFISLALCLILVFLLCPTVFAEESPPGDFILDAKDVPSEYWAREAIEMLNEHKIMLGYQGFFRPEDPITRVEFCALINRAFGYYKKAEKSVFKDSGNDPNNWKDEEILKAAYQGYLKGSDGYAYPDRNISREEAMVILARVLRKEPVSGKTSFIDDGEVSDWAKPLITALWKEGYVRGSGGRLNPKSSMTRAEVAQLMYNSIGELLDKSGLRDMENKVLGHVTISAPGVILKNAVIRGNLYITEGVGDGTVTLENVKVEGQTVIAGGGVQSVIIINTSMGRAVIDVPDGATVRFAAQGNSSIDTVMVLSDSIIDNETNSSIESVIIALPEDATVELSGSFGMVEVQTSSITMNAEDCSIEQLIVASTALDAEINLDSTASVGSLVCDAQCQVSGSGQIGSAIINVNDVTLEQRPNTLTLPKGVKAQVAGTELSSGYSDTAGSTTEPGGDGGNSGGGGDNGGGGNNGEERTYTLSVASDPQGAARISGAGVYKPGDSVTLVANPVEGWKFNNWTVDGLVVGTKSRLVYVMPERDVTVTANLEPLYTLTVLASGSGDVTPKQEQKLAGATVFTATAKAKTGHVFSHWEIDGETVSVEESFTYFMPYEDLVLTAVFIPEGTVIQWDGTISDTVPVSLKDGSYLISTGSQLAWIAQQVNAGNTFENKKFTLQNNINMSNIPWTPIGDINKEFRGTFNGNGKTISNLLVEVSDSDDNSLVAGLFGHIGKKGKVQKLNLINIDIKAAYSSYPGEDSHCYAGGIAGINDGEIKNCEVSFGTVEAANAHTVFAGGVAGWNRQGTIKGCANLTTVNVSSSEGSDAVAGGIAGENFGTIESCFNEGSISAQCEDGAHAGGITGYTYKCTIKDCFNTGGISSDGKYFASAGGIVGTCDALSKVSTCYNIGQISAQITNEAGEEGTIKGAGGIAGTLTTGQSGYVRDCYYLDSSADDGIGYFDGSIPAVLPVEGSDGAFRSEAFFVNFDFVKNWYFRPAGEYPYPHLREFLKTYKLTVKAAPSKGDKIGGTAVIDGEYGERLMPGAIVPLKATANEGYYFLNWTVNGEVVSEQEEFIYMMPARNVTIQANFVAEAPETYALHLSVEPSGAGTATGGGTYFAGETVSLKAQPSDENCHFEYWAEVQEGELREIGTEAEMQYVMPAEDTELIAVFTQSVETGNNYKLTYTSNPPEGGTVTVTLPAGQIEEGTLPGIEYQFTATPNEGYEFINWTVDGEDYGDAPTLRLEAPEKDINVVANFMEVVYCTLRIASSDANMGSAGTAGGQNTVILKGGEKVTLTATPKDGYAFSGWTIDGVVVSSDNPFEYTIPAQEEVTITANFREIVYHTLTIESSNADMGIAYAFREEENVIWREEGVEILLVAEAKQGYVFTEWTIDGIAISSQDVFFYTMPAYDVTIIANFTEWNEDVKFVMTVETNTNRGKVSISPDAADGAYPAWARIELIAEPYTGYEFECWTVDGEITETDSWYEFVMPAKNVTIVANFKQLPPPEGVDTSLDFARYWIWDFATDGNMHYVGVGEYGTVIHSDNNGYTWTQAWSGIDAKAVAYGKGKYIAIGEKEVALSEDGLHWEDISHLIPVDLSTTSLNDVAFGSFLEKSMFIITDGYYAYTSLDGETWDMVDMSFSGGFAEALEFGEGRCVAVGLGVAGYSDDGVNWTQVPIERLGSVIHCYSLAYGNGKFVAGTGRNVAISEDGISWTEVETTLTNSAYSITKPYTQYLSFADGLFFASYGDFYFTSTDGVEYTMYSMSEESRSSSSRLGMGVGDIFVATGRYGQLMVSWDDCETWEERIPDSPYYIHDYFHDGSVQIFTGEMLAWHSDFVSVSQGMIVTSAGGSSLKRYTLIPYDPDWIRVEGRIYSAAGNGQVYIAVGGEDYSRVWLANEIAYRSVIFISDDAGAWYVVECSVPYMLRDIVYSPTANLFAAVGSGTDGGIILTSTDGENWSAIYSVSGNPLSEEPLPLPRLNSIGWDPNVGFIAGGEGGVIFVSQDGADWTVLEIGEGKEVTQIEGNVVAGNILGEVKPDSEGEEPKFYRRPILDEDEVITAVAKDSKGRIHMALNGRISIFDGLNRFDSESECLTEIKKIIVKNEDPNGQQLYHTKMLYTDSGPVITLDYGNCGCILDKGAFVAGNGTPENPFIINSRRALEHIRQHASHDFYYRLETDDIILTGQWTPIGNWYNPFEGHFDGNGHSISVSNVSFPSDYEDYGLFGFIGEYGVVQDLKVEFMDSEIAIDYPNFGVICGGNRGSVINCEVSGKASLLVTLQYYAAVGGIAGYNTGTIAGCTVSGEFNIQTVRLNEETAGEAGIGGIVAYNSSGTVTRSANHAAISVSGDPKLCFNMGGIAGWSEGDADEYGEYFARIEDCYNAGVLSVSGTLWLAGGVVGVNMEYSEVSTSYNITDIQLLGEPDPDELSIVGGVLGINEGVVSSCYYLDEGDILLGVGNKASDDPDNTENTKKLSGEQMQDASNFAGFDFEGIWQIGEGTYPYPVLR